MPNILQSRGGGVNGPCSCQLIEFWNMVSMIQKLELKDTFGGEIFALLHINCQQTSLLE